MYIEDGYLCNTIWVQQPIKPGEGPKDFILNEYGIWGKMKTSKYKVNKEGLFEEI